MEYPIAGSNAGVVAVVAALPLFGLVLGSTPELRLCCLTFSLSTFGAAYLIKDTNFGKADYLGLTPIAEKINEKLFGVSEAHAR